MGHGHMHAAYSSSSGGGRRRWEAYVLVAIMTLIFVCGTLAVMGLHRLKETRNLSLLIKHKDDQILSLNRILQKERSKLQEVERKSKEMKMQIYNLRAHKTQLNGKISEMQSTISSLRDEQRTIESTFQEKENEANSFKQKYTETLQQKEAEIEDLKQQLSSRKDEPAITPTNITGNARETNNEEIKNPVDDKREVSMQMEEQRGNITNMIKNEHRDENGEARLGDDFVNSGKMTNSQGNEDQELGMQEKRSYLKRATGKRWRPVSTKKIEPKRHRGRQRQSEEIGNTPNDEDSKTLENVHDGGRGNVNKVKFNGYIEGNHGENNELHDSRTGIKDVAGKNEDSSDVQMEGFEESRIGSSNSTESAQKDEDDKEETEEAEF